MAHLKKVEEFARVSGMDALYAQMTTGIMQQINLEEQSRGNRDAAFLATVAGEMQKRIASTAKAYALKLYAEEYTDEEMDQLIAIVQLPVFLKMQETMPQMQQAIVTFMMETFDVEQLFETIFDELS